jgi:large subunit ribosomal protein L9e
MKTLVANQIVVIPEDVTVDVASRVVTVTGPLGKLQKSFKHLQLDISKVGKRRLKVEVWWGTKKQLACVRTVVAHIKNMIVGVTKGYTYKMRFVYNHFPINLAVTNEDKKTKKGDGVEIRNFLGEREVRKVPMLEGCTVLRSADVKDEIVITGIDIESVSQSAASIHQSILARNKDIRKFLDGIYVSSRTRGDVTQDV